MFSLMGDPVGSAVVFFHKVKEQRPLSLVRAVALTDLQASNLEGIREKTVCQARVLDKWWPCLVVEIEESRQLSEQIVKVYREEYHLEKRGIRLADELGLRRTAADQGRAVTAHNLAHQGRAESPEVLVTATNSHCGSVDRSYSSHSSAASPVKLPARVCLPLIPATFPRNSAPRARQHSAPSARQNVVRAVSSDDDVKEVIKVDDDLDEIQRNYNLNFLRRGLPPLELVPAMDRKTMAALEKLPKKVYSPHYKADITVLELRDAMWQNRTWQGATKGALRCIFTTDELKKGVPSPAGSLSRNKDLLDQNKLNVIFEISKEMLEKGFRRELDRSEFGKHVGTCKSCLRRELGLPAHFKRPHIKKTTKKEIKRRRVQKGRNREVSSEEEIDEEDGEEDTSSEMSD